MPKQVVADHPLPYNLEAERAVLGAVLLDNRMLDNVGEIAAEDLFLDQHKRIFSRMLELRERSEPIDSVTLMDSLNRTGELEAAGGAAYLAQLLDGVPRVTNIEHYARLVRRTADLRLIINTGHAIQQSAFALPDSLEDILDRAIVSLMDLTLRAESTADGETYREAARRLLMEVESKSALRVFSGVEGLDQITGGFRAGEVVVICAHTGTGKTLLAQQIRRRACTDKIHSLYASGEMDAPHLLARELATVAGVKHSRMRSPERLSPDDMQRLIEAASHECEHCRILDGELSLKRIRMAARRLKRHKGKLDLLILDYDELIDAPGRDDLERQKNLVRGAKAIAIEMKIPVIMISQLRKPLSPQESKNPTLDRIYGSGAKAKHASWVVFVDRPWVRELKGDEAEATISVLKGRDGPLGKIAAIFNVQSLTFQDADFGRSQNG